MIKTVTACPVSGEILVEMGGGDDGLNLACVEPDVGENVDVELLLQRETKIVAEKVGQNGTDRTALRKRQDAPEMSEDIAEDQAVADLVDHVIAVYGMEGLIEAVLAMHVDQILGNGVLRNADGDRLERDVQISRQLGKSVSDRLFDREGRRQ